MNGGRALQGRGRVNRKRADPDGDGRAGDVPAVNGAEQAVAEAMRRELETYRG